ncbi:MAG: hypothetical protein ACREIA_12370 [Opitutaceae bacterium]
MKPRTLALVHTSATLVPVFAQLCKERIPAVGTFNIVDDSLVRAIGARGALTPDIARRVASYITSADAGGADYILVTCSSIGPAVEAAAAFASVPVLRVDQPMADRAVATGKRIGAEGARGRGRPHPARAGLDGPRSRHIAAGRSARADSREPGHRDRLRRRATLTAETSFEFMLPIKKACLYALPVFVFALLAGVFTNSPALWKPAAVAASVSLALGLGALSPTRGYQFTAWIVAAVTAAMIYPNAFLRWGGLDLRNRWVVLFIVQGVMFGMGTQMKLRDFAGVMKMPWGVFVGLFCQFTVMPLTGLLFIAAAAHNSVGYVLGYWLSRLMRLDKDSARAVAFEVGLQNGGMASGIAGAMGKLGTVGLAAAIFSPWMNISGSILANCWKRKPAHPDREQQATDRSEAESSIPMP